jgi:hypothetical protein
MSSSKRKDRKVKQILLGIDTIGIVEDTRNRLRRVNIVLMYEISCTHV